VARPGWFDFASRMEYTFACTSVVRVLTPVVAVGPGMSRCTAAGSIAVCRLRAGSSCGSGHNSELGESAVPGGKGDRT
jgi:hypothetical protein